MSNHLIRFPYSSCDEEMVGGVVEIVGVVREEYGVGICGFCPGEVGSRVCGIGEEV